MTDDNQGLEKKPARRRFNRTPELQNGVPGLDQLLRIVGDAPRAQLPQRMRPMLATPAEAPFDDPNWLFEVKWDGYRAIAVIDRQRVRLLTRQEQLLNDDYPPIVDALQQLGVEAVLDGEVVVVDEEGRSRFQLLQKYRRTGRGRLVYYVFDLPHLEGRDLTGLPLRRRKEALQGLVGELEFVKYSGHVVGRGRDFFAAAVALGLEGILAKSASSPYMPGKRSTQWLKIKARQRLEAIIGGFTEPRGSRQYLGAVVLGVYDQAGELVYVGHTGGRGSEAQLRDLRRRLEALEQPESPFAIPPKPNAPVHWVKPHLVCEVSFSEWTADGRMRHPICEGLREDAEPREVRRERTKAARVFSAAPVGKASGERELAVGGRTLLIGNWNKPYWPKEGYTKGELVEYYRQVASAILPYLKDRPQSLHRFPDGIEGVSFYQKNVSEEQLPAGARTYAVTSESEGREIRYLVCDDEATLLYMVNLGCIEINPWSSRTVSPDSPDWCVIDLDPGKIGFAEVVRAALATREVLEAAGVASCCKTSGATGLHIYIPLGARYGYEQARQFGHIIAGLVNARLPETTSVERSPQKRRQQVYLDFLQNRAGQTLVAPYAVRPRPGAPVSTPLAWSEVKEGLDPLAFTMKTLPKRLDRVGDLWRPVLGPGADLAKALGALGGR